MHRDFVGILDFFRRPGITVCQRPNRQKKYLQPRTNKEAAVPRHNEINEYTAKAILKKLS
jgi:hypothetical protein